jgi:hypothetical protein
MTYRVERIRSVGIGVFEYMIYAEGSPLAKYWANLRDYEQGVRFEDGSVNEWWSLKDAESFLDGSPPQLTKYGQDWLRQRLEGTSDILRGRDKGHEV